jgi:hypothetical protein
VRYRVPPITKSVVKHRLVFVLLSTWDAYYVYDGHVFGEGLGYTRIEEDGVTVRNYDVPPAIPLIALSSPTPKL